MLECLKCKKPLTLRVDLESHKALCTNCSQEYNLSLLNKNIIISDGKKTSSISFTHSSFCDNKLSKKIFYELYKEGYVKCLKVVNTNFNNNDSEWLMPVKEIVERSRNWYDNAISRLKNKLDSLSYSEQIFYCPSCKSSSDFGIAVRNNFVCCTCSSNLKESKVETEKSIVLNQISSLRNEALSVFSRWS